MNKLITFLTFWISAGIAAFCFFGPNGLGVVATALALIQVFT